MNDQVTWTVIGSDGTIFEVEDVCFYREVVEVADCDDPSTVRREVGRNKFKGTMKRLASGIGHVTA